MSDHKDGLYDQIITNRIQSGLHEFEHIEREPIENEKLRVYLVQLLSGSIDQAIANQASDEKKIELANKILEVLNSEDRILDVGKAERLIALVRKKTSGTKWVERSPSTPLGQLGLITNGDYKLNMSSELKLELRSSNRVDILMSFVKKKGISILADELLALRERKIPVRLLTTVYTGATEKSALDYLVEELGVEVRVNYNADQSHLHAKAWLFKRDTGFSTAYVGSSNLSGTALTDGLEWNVRLSQIASPVVLDNFEKVFNAYWENDMFSEYLPQRDGDKLSDALEFARNKFSGGGSSVNSPLFMPNIDVMPREHQVKMLEDLQTQRLIFDRHKNLVVAATGTGKTVLAAIDYSRLQASLGKTPSLLFIAHRQEILDQSLATFRAVLKDWQFGEKFVGGHKPTQWKHVFASVQSLSSLDVSSLEPEQFDYVVVDEFHHASAKTYSQIMSYLKPKELLALTATPERGDGKRVQDEYFDGVIASELRLWDALDRQLLAPFDYFGVAEDTDYTGIDWTTGGRYDVKELEKKVTRNDLRDKLVLNQIKKNVSDPFTMRALVFCVGVEHAEYIGQLLNDNGLKAKVLTGNSQDAERSGAIRALGNGELNAIVTVDIFNEGVDIPEVDTILMLRPTESSVIFLQQLGRGLRKAPNKDSVTVLDFIGSHRNEFRMDKKFEALTGLLPGQLKTQIELGFPNLPGGMTINLDAKASELVLENIKAQLNYSNQRLTSLAQKAKTDSLRKFLQDSGLDLWTLYTKTSWLELRVESGLVKESDLLEGSVVLSQRGVKLLHIDDFPRIEAYKAIISGSRMPSKFSADEISSYEAMLFWSLFPDAKLPGGVLATSYNEAFSEIRTHQQVIDEWLEILEIVSERAIAPVVKIDFAKRDLPLLAHASYTRDEILGAVGWSFLASGSEDKTRKSKGHQVGVSYIKDLDMDLFFVNLSKDAKRFTESTRYKDYAISKTLFNWESQNKDSEETTDGKRYINQRVTKHDVLLCVREKSDGGAFKILGLADYRDHSGSKPLEIRWELRTPLDVATFDLAAAFKVS